MHRTAFTSASARLPLGPSGYWLNRRWYYTPATHRAYSVRQISPGDRRLLAEFALSLSADATHRSREDVQALTSMLLERVIDIRKPTAVGFVALDNSTSRDRVIGAAACEFSEESARFGVAVAQSYRNEEVGRTLLATLVRHARRIGIRRLEGEMAWSNRPMHLLAQSLGFQVEPVTHDRGRRRLLLPLR